MEDVGGHFGRGPDYPGPGGEGGDGQHHGRVRPGLRWWPRQVEEGLVREGPSEGDGGLEEEQVPGCRGPVAAAVKRQSTSVAAVRGSFPTLETFPGHSCSQCILSKKRDWVTRWISKSLRNMDRYRSRSYGPK
jgi:hypothetical protein